MNPKIPKPETLRKRSEENSASADASPPLPRGRKAKPDPLEKLPESARWDPVVESSAKQAPEVRPDDDENEDGENEAAQLVEEGIAAADDEQAEQADRRNAERDRRGNS